ncbi:hypothetical protein BN3590_04606 [Clostridium sp. C105KSO15]|nr:hypothetical protein BN3590_04606 [Clostridium sp. C105KSO15]
MDKITHEMRLSYWAPVDLTGYDHIIPVNSSANLLSVIAFKYFALKIPAASAGVSIEFLSKRSGRSALITVLLSLDT